MAVTFDYVDEIVREKSVRTRKTLLNNFLLHFAPIYATPAASKDQKTNTLINFRSELKFVIVCNFQLFHGFPCNFQSQIKKNQGILVYRPPP